MKEVVIAGGTGFIGSHLTRFFLDEGYSVNILSRRAKKSETANLRYYAWDADNGTAPQDIIDRASYVINLAGANVGSKRWNKEYKKEILESRINSTKTLVDAINKSTGRVEAFFCANAIGYYGPDRQEPQTEKDPPGDDFMADVCVAWQKEAEKLDQNKTRLLIYRFGIILSAEEGAMKQMMLPIKLFLGAPLGSGKQVVPWIHIEDLCRMIFWGLGSTKISGIYNAVGPEPVTNRTLTHVLARQLHRPVIMPPVPGFILKLALGEFAASVLGSFPVSAQKIVQSGYRFRFPELIKAVEDLLEKQQ